MDWLNQSYNLICDRLNHFNNFYKDCAYCTYYSDFAHCVGVGVTKFRLCALCTKVENGFN